MNNQFCMKRNGHMYLTWLLLSLFRSVFGGSCAAHVSTQNSESNKTNASFLFFQSALLPWSTATGRLVLRWKTDSSLFGNHDGSSSLRFRSLFSESTPLQFKTKRKNRATSCSAIHLLIQFFHVRIRNIKSIIDRQLVIQERGIAR